MKVAITGATGRLGRTVIDRLLNDSEIEEIIALDTSPFDFKNEKLVVFWFHSWE